LHKNQYIHLTDEALLHQYRKQGDKEWLGVLLQRYTLLLLGVALKYLKDKQLAEDAVQQVFLKVFTHLPQEEILNFKGWLYILTRNHCLQQLRTKNYFASEEALQYLPDDEAAFQQALEKEVSLNLLNDALKELVPEQRITIDYFYLKKYSYQQIMELTGFNFMQVKSYIQNGKRNLKLSILNKQKSIKP